MTTIYLVLGFLLLAAICAAAAYMQRYRHPPQRQPRRDRGLPGVVDGEDHL